MDGSFSDYQVHQWLLEVSDGSWVSLHYDTPALGGTGLNEVSGGGYLRQQAHFSSPANRAIWSLADVRFTGLLQHQLTHFGIWNDQDQGDLLAYASLPERVTVLNGWGYTIRQGELALSFG